MLTFLSIQQFVLIESAQLKLPADMITITGETGAGKSIFIEAINALLGARTNKKWLASDSQPTEICGHFDLSNTPSLQERLAAMQIELNEDQSCIIRRSISPKGRSQAFINDTSVTLNTLKHITQPLVNLCGQHAYHALQGTDRQLDLIDRALGLMPLRQTVKTHYEKAMTAYDQLNALKQAIDQQNTEKQLLEYQQQELAELALEKDELETLQTLHAQLSTSEQTASQLEQINQQLYQDDQSLINQAQRLVDQFDQLPDAFASESVSQARQLLEQAKVYLEETHEETKNLTDQIEINPEKLQQIETRLSDIYALARKHQVLPEQLTEHHQMIQNKLASFDQKHQNYQTYQSEYEHHWHNYCQQAQKLHQQRAEKAPKLADTITHYVRQLNMPKATVDIVFTETTPTARGTDHCQIQACLNPGKPAAAIDAVASGGELSRINLAIQVATAGETLPETLIFDEIDVGISGQAAETVGQLLKQLTDQYHHQILCITHQPQVAAQGSYQLAIKKSQKNDQTISSIHWLNQDQRIEAIAHMVSGQTITQETRHYARCLLEQQRLI